MTKLEKHMMEEHGRGLKQAWDELNGGAVVCRCGCGSETKFLGWKKGYSDFVVGHNANIYDVYDEKRAAEVAKSRGVNWRGKASPWKGLTAENSEEVRRRADAAAATIRTQFEEGRRAWNKDLTKKTDVRLANYAEKMSRQFKDGKKKIWHEGLTSEEDVRLAAKGEAASRRYRSGELKQWHAGKTVFDDARIEKFWSSRDPVVEYSNVRWSHDEIEDSLRKNTQVRLERIDGYRNDRTQALWMRCVGCGWFEKVSLVFARADRCPKCHPQGSVLQNDVLTWIKSLGVIAVGNVSGVIGRQELDIFIPSLGVAVEVNGLYWHNELSGKHEQYHQSKLEKCRGLNISLMHIFEDEWHQKNDIVKSMLCHRLGLTSKKIDARKCSVVEVDARTRKKFFDENHIEGDVQATTTWGLMYDGVLVECMSLRRPFHKKNQSMLEIARSASHRGVLVRGGVGKLMRRVVEYAKSNGYGGIITYVDRRFGFFGAAYAAAGLIKVGETPPRFWWTDFHRRYNRFKFRANKKAGQTEAEVAAAAGVTKIWGCSNLIYEMRW